MDKKDYSDTVYAQLHLSALTVIQFSKKKYNLYVKINPNQKIYLVKI